jgi:hypothetical protein
MSRKVVFIIAAVLIMVPPGARAQKHPQFRYIGLDAGMTMAGIRSSADYVSHARNFGARVALSGNYSLSSSKSAEAALVFEQKGAADPVFDITTNLNYLTLPVYFKLVAGNDPQLYITAGAYASRLINASRKGGRYVEGRPDIVNEKVTASFRSLDAGLMVGVGMMIRLYEDFDFIVSAGISGGFLKIDDLPGHKPRNYNISISVGYIYYIGYR